MASLKAIELKFLLELINCDGYRGNFSQIKPNSSTRLAEWTKICEALVANGYVDCSKEVARFVISGAGKALLNKDIDRLPISLDPKEIETLRACTEKITPGKLGKKVPADERQTLLQSLSGRGLIKISETKITEVWLSAQGKHFLLEECAPDKYWLITAAKLGYYVKFLRENTGQRQSQNASEQPSAPQRILNRIIDAVPISSQSSKPDAQAVFQQIRQLDQQIDSKNYLPIYHLRNAFQSSLTRSELDSILYSLQREGRIDLSSLHNQGKYTSEQISAGIRQDNGGYLFFVSAL